MKLKKYNFRDIDRKWILIDDDRDIKRVNKLGKLDLSFDPVLGLIYIDIENGLTLRIVGNVYKDKSGYSFNDEFINNKVINIILNKKTNFDITILNDKVSSCINSTEAINKQIDIFYTKKAILESRKMKCLDKFRHKYFPDDIELYNKLDKKEEIIWGRVIDCSLNNNIVVCSLLDDSIIDKKYKKDTLVMAKHEIIDKEEAIVIKNSVKRVEKNVD